MNRTALHYASYYGYEDIVDMILEKVSSSSRQQTAATADVEHEHQREQEEKERKRKEEEESKKFRESALSKETEAKPGMVWNKVTQEYQYLNTDESWRD